MCESFLSLSPRFFVLGLFFFFGHAAGPWDLGSLIRDLTHTPCIRLTESLPHDHQEVLPLSLS